MAIPTDALLEEVLQTRAASRRLVRELDIIKSRVGLACASYTQGHILLHVEGKGLLTVAELADLLRLDKSTTSRAVATMIKEGYLKYREDKNDKRLKPVTLTLQGRRLVERIHDVANAEVSGALELLSPGERRTVVEGMQLYARALHRSRLQHRYDIRTIEKGDNEYVARVIHDVMTEFELDRPGTSLGDEEVKAMYEAYSNDRARYFVVLDGDRIVGGAGIGPLEGGEGDTCELKKMYLLPEVRGAGLGERLLELCLDAAREAGYQKCYLETIRQMTAARALYEKHGFKELCAPMGRTGHFGCDSWFALDL
jgi:putative acetyltransferase